jgi:hypothetical protein
MHSRRFGPLISKEEEDRRSLKEHITSSGNYYWKNNDKQKLISSSRKALFQQLVRMHPGWSQLSRADQVSLLAEQTKMNAQSVDKLLFDNDFTQPDDFTHLIRQLENIRNNI